MIKRERVEIKHIHSCWLAVKCRIVPRNQTHKLAFVMVKEKYVKIKKKRGEKIFFFFFFSSLFRMFFKVSRKRQRSRGGKLTWQMQECDVGEKAGNRRVCGDKVLFKQSCC